ncbi:hypothetical protein BP00DRAFT_424070 [Aspergillus indologenus CBS 114.80]|uniref:Ubiquitin 3 binding protein But2 C-terminal domain-containing protein n=1 Tax=Aspergillus indologenus CBS 114.80 TaxID=1450541 RepID=A0A2V5IX83_9EURO|nr:hypothetical protein BP00DRAFT_424070 [Aspergillus indologenus CBS 114.80]
MRFSFLTGFLTPGLCGSAYGWHSTANIHRVVNGTTLWLLPDDVNLDMYTVDLMPVRFRTPPPDLDGRAWTFEFNDGILNSTTMTWLGASLYCGDGMCRMDNMLNPNLLVLDQVNEGQTTYTIRRVGENGYLMQGPDMFLRYKDDLADTSYFQITTISKEA